MAHKETHRINSLDNEKGFSKLLSKEDKGILFL